MHPQPAVTSDSRGPACTPTTPRQFQVSGWEVRQPSGDRVTTEESRETLEPGWGKSPRSSFTTATSGGWEHATGLRAAATFSAFLAPPRQIRPLASASPASRLPPVRRPSPSSRIRASSENAGSRCDRSAGPKPRARSHARRTSLRMRRGWMRVRRPHEWLELVFRPMRAPAPESYAFLSRNTRNRLTCKFLASDAFSLITEGGNPILLCKPPS